MFYYHGFEKIMEGKERWNKLGRWLSDILGSDSLSTPLGFMASFSESIAAIFIILGLFTRTSAFLLMFTMLIASLKNISSKGIENSELSLIYFFLTLIILIRGSGKYSFDRFIFNKS